MNICLNAALEEQDEWLKRWRPWPQQASKAPAHALPHFAPMPRLPSADQLRSSQGQVHSHPHSQVHSHPHGQVHSHPHGQVHSLQAKGQMAGQMAGHMAGPGQMASDEDGSCRSTWPLRFDDAMGGEAPPHNAVTRQPPRTDALADAAYRETALSSVVMHSAFGACSDTAASPMIRRTFHAQVSSHELP